MGKYKPESKYFLAEDLEDKEITVINFNVTKVTRVLLKGKVENQLGEKVKNAGVEIFKIDEFTEEEVFQGLVFTDEEGVYAFSIESLKEERYIVKIYSAIN